MLFDFKLQPVDEITPWGEPPNLDLSWFALTYGFYRLNVGNERLFSYSNEISNLWKADYSDFSADYVEYQVVRFWEDVLEILPNVLAPIPPELSVWFSGDNPKILKLFQASDQWLRSGREKSIVAEAALGWVQNRVLDSGHLETGPRIWIWSDLETVTITWDNRQCLIDGVEVWSAKCGSYSMTRAIFLKEIQRFNDDFIAQMQRRVDDICAGWSRPHIRIDFENLRKQQRERPRELDRSLSCPGDPIDLQNTLSAIELISKSNAL